MIDINELRRLAQAASHPTTKGRWIRLFGERTVYDRMEDGCRGIPVVSTDKHPPSSFEAACLDFIAAANPAVINSLLERLEAAESDALEQARLNGMGSEREAALMAKLEAAEKERDALRAALRHEADCVDAAKAEIEALRARIEAMEQQEPVAWLHETRRDSDVVTDAVKHVWGKAVVGALAAYSIPLILAPGAKGEIK